MKAFGNYQPWIVIPKHIPAIPVLRGSKAIGQGAVERPILAKAHAESAKFRASKLDKCCEHCASAGQIVEEGNVVMGESAKRKSMKPMFLFIKYGVNHGLLTSNMAWS